jgi:hypothetical protein
MSTISLRNHKRLWANSGKVCAFPGCEQFLLIPTEGLDDEVIVGQECHIVAQGEAGPRAPATLKPEEIAAFGHLINDRDGYANLILLCGVHHTQIDGDAAAFTVERLVRMKADHEKQSDEKRTPKARKADEIEVRYAAIIDEWERRIDIDAWDSNFSNLVSDGIVDGAILDELPRLNHWLLGRVWPRTMPDLEAALQNFRFISQDLEGLVTWFATRRAGAVLVDRVYKENHYEQEQYEFLLKRSNYHRDLAADLTIELTRAVNLVADRVRENLWPSYRLDQGRTTIGIGLDMNMSYRTLVPLYDVGAPDKPYPGLQQFAIDRADRSYSVGEGLPPRGCGIPGLVESGDAAQDHM